MDRPNEQSHKFLVPITDMYAQSLLYTHMPTYQSGREMSDMPVL